mgnify:CR=1 FL=1
MSGKVYGGTSATGHLFVYNPATGLSTDLGQAVAGIDNVKSLTVSGGKIYGGTGEYGVNAHLFAYNPANGSRIDLGVAVVGEYYINVLTTGTDGRIYGGTSPSGHLFVYDPTTDTFSDKGTAAPGGEIHALAVASDGKVYGGSYGGFLFAYNPASGLFVNLGQPVPSESYVYALAVSADGKVYGGTAYPAGHLFVYDPATSAITDMGRAKWGGNYVYALLGAADGKIYGGTADPEGHFFAYDPADHPYRSPGTATSIDIIPAVDNLGSLGANYVYALAKGNAGKIYIGSDYIGRLWVYDPADGSLADLGSAVAGEYSINSLAVGSDGKIYGGTYSDGHLFVYDPTTGLSTDLGKPVATDSYVRSLVTGADGRIYGGTYGYQDTSGHLFVYNPTAGLLTDKGQAVPGERGVFALTRGADGKIYGGTYPDGHLFVYDPSSGSLTDLGTGAPGDMYISALVTGPDGTLYGTGYDGYLFSYRPVSGVYTNLGTPVSGGYDNRALVVDGTDLYGSSYLYSNGRQTSVLYSYDTGSGTTRVIGIPESRAYYLWALVKGDGGQIYGGTGYDNYLFAYEPGFAFEWSSVAFSIDNPANTVLHVDILSRQGTVLLDNVSSSASLTSIDSTTHPSLRLRAELSTSAGDVSPQLLDWTVTWTTVSVSPESLYFLLSSDEPDTASRSVHISTTGEDALSWTAQDDQSWLSVSPGAGIVPTTLTVTVDKTGLVPNTWYSGTVTVEWVSDLETGSADIDVMLYVGEHWDVFLPLVFRAH